MNDWVTKQNLSGMNTTLKESTSKISNKDSNKGSGNESRVSPERRSENKRKH
jgi:hypothetical protein